MILLLRNGQRVNNSLTLHNSVSVVHLASSNLIGILSLDIVTGRKKRIHGTMKYFCERERSQFHITCVRVYCYNWFFFLFFTVFNLLLCLIYKLSFIIVMYGSGRSSRVGKGNPLQYSCLENSMDGGVC